MDQEFRFSLFSFIIAHDLEEINKKYILFYFYYCKIN